jgi:hypothetical protein
MKLKRQVIVVLPDEHAVFKVHYKRAPLRDVADFKGMGSELSAAKDNLEAIQQGGADQLDGNAAATVASGLDLAIDMYAKVLPKLVRQIDGADLPEEMIAKLEAAKAEAEKTAQERTKVLREAALLAAEDDEERAAALIIEVEPEEVDPRKVLDFKACAALPFEEEVFEFEVEREGEKPVDREMVWREMSHAERIATIDAYMHLGEVLLPAVLDQDSAQVLGKLRPRRSLVGGPRR